MFFYGSITPEMGKQKDPRNEFRGSLVERGKSYAQP